MIDKVSPDLLAQGLVSGGDGKKDDPARVEDAAKQFEALLISQMFKSMRESAGWLGTGDDQAGATAMELAEEQFAQTISTNGGLGLARLIVSGLEREK